MLYSASTGSSKAALRLKEASMTSRPPMTILVVSPMRPSLRTVANNSAVMAWVVGGSSTLKPAIGLMALKALSKAISQKEQKEELFPQRELDD